MKRVTGFGGVFFKSKNPKELKHWYDKHLGIEFGEYGKEFFWRDFDNPEKTGYTVWSPFNESTKYLEPSSKDYMINFRVENLDELLILLKSEGIEPCGEKEESEFGKFAWIIDPDGTKVELWEPPKTV